MLHNIKNNIIEIDFTAIAVKSSFMIILFIEINIEFCWIRKLNYHES